MLLDPRWNDPPRRDNDLEPIPVYDSRQPGEYHGKHFHRPIYRWRHPDPDVDRMITDLCHWLEAKPKDHRYSYKQPHGCLFSMFGRQCSYPWLIDVRDLKEFDYVARGTPK